MKSLRFGSLDAPEFGCLLGVALVVAAVTTPANHFTSRQSIVKHSAIDSEAKGRHSRRRVLCDPQETRSVSLCSRLLRPSSNVFAMNEVQHSQLAPLPTKNVPFRLVSRTIGSGAYAW